MPKSEQAIKYKKSPLAPRRFKSAYMFFSEKQHKSIRKEHTETMQTTNVAKMVSQAWKALSKEEREKWDELAKRDKARYQMEKSTYSGPWKVPVTRARRRKDPNAPKRPMSAFLAYSNAKRTEAKAKYPNAAPAEISKTLAQMWKHAPEEERKIYIDKEFALRQAYKIVIAKWRKNEDSERKAAMKQREDLALQKVDAAGSSWMQDPLAVTAQNSTEFNDGIVNCSQALDGVEPHLSIKSEGAPENESVVGNSAHNRTQPTEFYPDALPAVAYGGYYDMYGGAMGTTPAMGTYATTHEMMVPRAHAQTYQHQIGMAQNGPGHYDSNNAFSGSYGHYYPQQALLPHQSLHPGLGGGIVGNSGSGNREVWWGRPFYGTTSENQNIPNKTSAKTDLP